MKRSELLEYVAYLRPLLLGRYLSRPSFFTSTSLSFHLSGGPQDRLSFILEGEEPRFYLASGSLPGKSLESSFLDVLKKRLYRARIEEVEVLANDRIVSFALTANEEALFSKKRKLVFELIPRHPNLVLLDEEERVITAFRVTPIDGKRPLFRGLKYQIPPQNAFVDENRKLDLTGLLAHYEELESGLRSKRKNERFAGLASYLANREKSLKRKIASLGGDLSKAKERLDGQRKGDLLLTYLPSLGEGEAEIELEGVKIVLDPRKNAAQNANAFYRQAKKAKDAIRLGEAHLKEAEEELLDLQSAKEQFLSSDEEGLELLASELSIPQKGRPAPGWRGLSRSSLPYECLVDGIHLLYGRSAKENDCLSFLFARGRKLHWFHILGGSGSHLVLKSENPSAKAIRLTAEIAILLAGREDGDVIHALRGEISRGNKPGEVRLREHEVIHVKGVSEEAKGILAKAKRRERP